MLLDGRPLQGETGKRGVGRYVRDLAAGLLELSGNHEVDLLYNPRRGPLVDPPQHPRSAIVAARTPPGPALLWGRLLGPSWIAADSADLWHSTFLAPPRVPRKMPWVATIHDLIPLRHPDPFTKKQQEVFRRSLAISARAPRVVTVSRYTADRVADQLGVPSGKLRVIPPPVNLEPFENPPWKGVRGVDQPYLLHLGGFDPLKGVCDQLLPAFEKLSRGRGDLHLVLTGPDSPARRRAEQAAEELGLTERTVFAGHLPSPAHEAAVAGSRAVVISSREEGFGIPAVEALAAGVPLVVGSAEATREIGPEVAFQARGDSPVALAAAIEDALECGEGDRERFRRAALPYSRPAVAEQMLAVYEELAGG